MALLSMRRRPPCVSAWASPQPVLHESDQNEESPSSASVIAAAVNAAASSAVEFSQKVEEEAKGPFSGPSAEFSELCQEQLAICDGLLEHNAKLTVYIRSADSYGTGHLELKRVATHPKWILGDQDETLVLVGIFESASLLRSAEAALSKQEAVELPEFNALVLPMVKDIFLVGVLVAEWRISRTQRVSKQSKLRAVRPVWPPRQRTVHMQEAEEMTAPEKSNDDHQLSTHANAFTQEQQVETIKIARSLALACVMDQRTLLLQQSSWQRGVRIGDLLEQVRGPLAAIRTLGKMLQPQLKQGEISSDVLEDILVQGERMKDVVQQFQEVFYLTQHRSSLLSSSESETSSRVLLNSDSLKMAEPSAVQDFGLVVPNGIAKRDATQLNSLISTGHSSQRDKEAPMPPVALAPLMHSDIKSCDVSKLLIDLVGSGAVLAHQKGQALELKENLHDAPFLAAIDESSLRQAFSNLLDSSLQHTLPGGWVKVEVMQAPGGGVLVVIDDNGPDLSLLSQAQALAPLGSGFEVGAQGRRDARVILNIGAELTVAQGILEQFGAVLRITSPYLPKAPSGIGGTRLEVWLPAPPVRCDFLTCNESQ